MTPRSALATALVLAAAPWLSPPAGACTTFCMKDGGQIIFGKNYDWNVAEGMIVVNKRGVHKRTAAAGSHATWESRHGSVTFNQYGREFPSGGINEAGLVIELMWLDGTRYPEEDSRPAVGGLQWIQYQLDTAASVQDVLDSDSRIRIAAAAPLHYLVADARGNVAAVEFLEGRMVAHTGGSLPFAALANHTYARSAAYAKSLEASGRAARRDSGSLDRFARAARRVESFRSTGPGEAVAYAFETLRQVAQGGATQWSIVYDVGARRVHFKTALNERVRTLSLGELDFDCARPVLIADLHEGESGDFRPHLRPYDPSANGDLVRDSYSKTSFLTGLPDEVARWQASFPETTSCSGFPEPR